MWRAASTGCPHTEDPKEGEFNSQTRTLIILNGIDPLAPEVADAKKRIDANTQSTNAQCLVYLGNVVTSLHQTDILPKGGKSELITVLGRSELELLRFMPRPGGEIELVREGDPEAAARALLRPPQLLDSAHQPKQLPPKWANVYAPNLREAMMPLVELYRRVEAYEQGLEQLETHEIVYEYSSTSAHQAASTSGRSSRPPANLWTAWTPATAKHCHTYHDVFCMFTVAMCLKFFYMWDQTTIYTHKASAFLDDFESQNDKDPAVYRLVDMCRQDLVKSTKQLALTHVDDDMRTACVKLMSTVSHFMNHVFCNYLSHSSGLVAKVAAMTETGEEGERASSALCIMYEDNEYALSSLPTGSDGWNASNSSLMVTWERMAGSENTRVEQSRRHLHELLAEMCSETQLSSAMAARLSGYVSVAHASANPGGAITTGQAVYGTFDNHGMLRTHTFSKQKLYIQAACAVGVGTGDVGVATWCPSTATSLETTLAPKAISGGTGSLAAMQRIVVQEALETFPARRQGHRGRLRGTIKSAIDGDTYRISTWDNGATMLLPEQWVQTCFLDLARRVKPSLDRRPLLGVLSRLDRSSATLATMAVENDWAFEHNGDQLIGLAVEWAYVEPTLHGPRDDALLLLVEDRASGEIQKLF